LSRLPTLFVIGSGLGPALLAYWISRPGKKVWGNVSI